MKIKMIGTGAISVKERSACCLIDEKILVDCGNGTIKTLLQYDIDITKIDTLLITHLHGDHFLDIPFLIMLRNSYNIQNEFKIYCPIGTEETVGKIIELAFPDIKDWTELRDKVKVKFIEFERLNDLEVTLGYFINSYNVIHSDLKRAYGYTIRNNDKIVGISGDSSYCDNIDNIVKESNIAILDTSLRSGNDKHMGIDDIELLLNKYDKRIIATHMQQKTRMTLKEMKMDNLIIPEDGEEFNI